MSIRRTFLILGIMFGIIAASGWIRHSVVSAQQVSQKESAQPTAKQPTAKGQDDGPVAITPPRKSVEPPPAQPTPLPKNHFGNMGPPFINNRGEVVFMGNFMPDQVTTKMSISYFLFTVDGVLTRSIRGDEKVENATAPLMGLGNLGLNNNGDVIFTGAIDKPAPCLTISGDEKCITENQKLSGVFTKTAKGINSVVFIGDEVQNTPSKFLAFSNASLNTKGGLAFVGTYTDPDGRGLFILEDGKMKLVARSGQKTPAGEETHYSEHFYPSPINDNSEMAFFCRISGGGAIFVRRPTGIEAIAVQDKPSPIAGSNYIGFGNRAPAINQKGDVVFAGFVDGEKAGRILFLHSGGKTTVVARSGDTLPESQATFTDFSMPSINSKGEIVFVGNYARGARGVFLKTAQGIETIAIYDRVPPGLDRTEPNLFNNFLNPVINENGDVAFLGQLKSSSIGIFLKKKGEPLKIIARTGDPIPMK